MKRFVEGEDRRQGVLLPEFWTTRRKKFGACDRRVRRRAGLGDAWLRGGRAGGDRPAWLPSGLLLKIYVYGYINQVASSRRLEREAQRNVELMWLTGRLAPDFKTIADFRKDNGPAIRAACRRSLSCAGGWSCSPTPWRRSTAASSRR